MALQDLTPQLRTRLGRVERLVGLFLLATILLAVVALGFYIRHIAKARGWFTVKVPYYTMIGDATGLRVGSPVLMKGFVVGEITRVDTTDWSPWHIENNFNVFVGFIVRHPYHGYIWTDSKVKLGAGSFLGDRSLEIIRGSTGFKTVIADPGQPALILTEKYAWKPAETKTNYLTEAEAPNGYYLTADEEQPLPVRLTEIANQVNDALPGVFAMTNQVNIALGNLTNITAQLAGTMPKVDGAIADARLLIGDLRPALQKPGGLGELVLPTNLNTQITLLVSNLNPGSGPLAITLSNVNQRLSDIGLTLTNVNHQLGLNTNLLADANKLTRDVGSLASSIETLLRKHWIFRSAFKTNEAKQK
jgi:ABC-type transporter Mla subunit MlaD